MLASRSPQRRAILEQLGIPFEVRVPDVDELTAGNRSAWCYENARRKAAAAAAGEAERRVLGVDTAVLIDGRPARQARRHERGARASWSGSPGNPHMS